MRNNGFLLRVLSMEQHEEAVVPLWVFCVCLMLACLAECRGELIMQRQWDLRGRLCVRAQESGT